jgi:pyridoxamine 5'-phosphate oxidase family protein
VTAMSTPSLSPTFTAEELAYLASQRLGRLATVDRQGMPQNSPVGFAVTDDGRVIISGLHLGASRKFHNVAATGKVSLVVDDLASTDPWRVRGVEVRGPADALEDVEPLGRGLSREQIVIHPTRIISWGVDSPEGLTAS